MAKGKRGGFNITPPEQLLSATFRGVIERSKVDPKLIQDIVVGNALQPAAGQVTSRMAQLLADIPDSTSLMAINRQCSSGLQACMNIAESIIAGRIDIGIGAGVESMSMFDMQGIVDPEKLYEGVFEHPVARNCLMPMGITSEVRTDNLHNIYRMSRRLMELPGKCKINQLCNLMPKLTKHRRMGGLKMKLLQLKLK